MQSLDFAPDTSRIYSPRVFARRPSGPRISVRPPLCTRGDAMESSLSPAICCIRGAVMSRGWRSGRVGPLHKKKKNLSRVKTREGKRETVSFTLNDLRRILKRRSKVSFSHENSWILQQSSHRYPHVRHVSLIWTGADSLRFFVVGWFFFQPRKTALCSCVKIYTNTLIGPQAR